MSLKELKHKKETPKLDKLKIYVLDAETTGLVGVPHDLVLSIGVSEVDIINQTVEPYFNRVLGYDLEKHKHIINKNTWIIKNSPLELDQIQFAFDNDQKAEDVAKEFNKAMEGKWIAIYNKDYDYGKFLRYAPFNLDQTKILPCLMISATVPCAIPNPWRPGYKWPALEEAVSILLDKEDKDILNKTEDFHDALFDTYASGLVMLKLIEMGHYNIMSYINQ